MDSQKIKALIDLINASDVSELTYQEGDVSLTLQRQSYAKGSTTQASEVTKTEGSHAVEPATSGSPSSISDSSDAAFIRAVHNEVQSPLHGVLYLSPSEEEQAYVSVGDEVVEGQTLGLLEAMKMFHPIQAEVAGTIQEICVSSGSDVESGQVLFLIG